MRAPIRCLDLSNCYGGQISKVEGDWAKRFNLNAYRGVSGGGYYLVNG
jgi:hypothetical protein